MAVRSSGKHGLTDKEAQLSARRLIADYGAEAEALAEMRIAEMLKINDNAGAVSWTRVLGVIRAIRTREAKPS